MTKIELLPCFMTINHAFDDLLEIQSTFELKILRATPIEELSMLCNLYLSILEEKKESSTVIVSPLSKIARHLSRSFRILDIACMCG